MQEESNEFRKLSHVAANACLRRERPISFNASMALAALEGRKTQTRRIIDPQPEVTPSAMSGIDRSKYGERGDLLWVREPFTLTTDSRRKYCVLYRADLVARELLLSECGLGFPIGVGEKVRARYGNKPDLHYWKRPDFMCRAYSRTTLEITDVRVERLQDISEKDARAEGIDPVACSPAGRGDGATGWLLCKPAFETLWGSIYGPESVSKNPWVWVIEFQLLPPTQKAA